MAYTPPARFNTPMYLLIPTVTKVNGVTKKTYPETSDSHLFFGTFRTFGGTEVVENGVLSVRATATIDTWFDPIISGDCRIAFEDGTQYEIIGEPENIEMLNQYLRIKVERLKGKV